MTSVSKVFSNFVYCMFPGMDLPVFSESSTYSFLPAGLRETGHSVLTKMLHETKSRTPPSQDLAGETAGVV